MNDRRIPVFLVGLVVIALLFLGRSVMIQDAWTDGFIMGQLASGAENPALIYAMQGGRQAAGGIGSFFLFFFLGALFFGGMVMRKIFHMRHWMADGPQGEDHRKEWMARWERRHGHKPPWASHSEARAEEPATPAPAQPSTPAPATPPAEPTDSAT